jgi:hypothetical protein
MKKLFQNITIFAVVFATMYGVSGNVQAMRNTPVISNASFTMPVQQVVVYQSQSVAYDNFNAAIFAQGQLGESTKLPLNSEVTFYVDPSMVNGATGLQTGTRCTTAQSTASYYQNTITMDGRFCVDFNDAILDGRAVYGTVPTESVFLHKTNGERCYVTGNGGALYTTNPASPFLRNYLVNRGAEKLRQFNLNVLFLDDIQIGWNDLVSNCGGVPKEYANLSDYLTQMVGLAQYVHDNLPTYKIEGNLASATAEWDKFSFLDGAMCESCFTNWGGTWPSAPRMLSDLAVMDKWIKAGHKLYVVSQAPDTSAASNRFTFAASLLVANGNKVYFHFGADYGQFYSMPEYKYNLGLPTAVYACSGNICTRKFEHGTVTVDFGKLEGAIVIDQSSVTPTATLSTPIPTLILPSATSPFVTATVALPSFTPTASPLPVTATQTTAPTATPQPTNVASTGTNSIDVRVSSGKDDVEENSSGGVSINSNDLELIYDNNAQVVGLRFTGVKIPKGAAITNAYVQFKTDQTSSKLLKLVVNGESSANASAFTSAARNVSKRSRTSSSVIWNPLAWLKTGETGTAQRTPNLKSIVQEIINQSNWNSGNSLVIIVTGTTGKRIAKSFEGDSSGAPLLHVEFSLPVKAVLSPATAT